MNIIPNTQAYKLRGLAANFNETIEALHEANDITIANLENNVPNACIMIKAISNNIAKLRQLEIASNAPKSIATMLITEAEKYCVENKFTKIVTACPTHHLDAFTLCGFTNTNESFMKNEISYFQLEKNLS